MLNAKEVAELCGEFTWDFGQHFFIETEKGNFIWSDPDYGGDNTLTPFEGGIKNFFTDDGYGRDKGTHIISDYCGNFIYNVDYLYELCKELEH